MCIEHVDLFVGQICGNSRASVDWQSRNANWATWEDIKIFLCCTAFIYASVQICFFYTFAFNICVIIICCWIFGDIYQTKQNWTCHWKWQTVMYDENLFYVKKISCFTKFYFRTLELKDFSSRKWRQRLKCIMAWH